MTLDFHGNALCVCVWVGDLVGEYVNERTEREV